MGIKRGNIKTEDFEWVTNRDLIDSAHMLLGEITLDPASSDFANEYVQAKNYYTPVNDPLNEDEWYGNVYLFPPQFSYYFNKKEDKWLRTRGLSPTLTAGHALWWKTLKRKWLEGKVEQAIFFSNYIDITMYVQDIFDHPVCIMKSRPRLMRHYLATDETMHKTTGCSVIVYLQPRDNVQDATENFIDIYGEKGRILV